MQLVHFPASQCTEGLLGGSGYDLIAFFLCCTVSVVIILGRECSQPRASTWRFGPSLRTQHVIDDCLGHPGAQNVRLEWISDEDVEARG